MHMQNLGGQTKSIMVFPKWPLKQFSNDSRKSNTKIITLIIVTMPWPNTMGANSLRIQSEFLAICSKRVKNTKSIWFCFSLVEKLASFFKPATKHSNRIRVITFDGMPTKWDNSKIVTTAQMFNFKWRFPCPCRLYCLSSLLIGWERLRNVRHWETLAGGVGYLQPRGHVSSSSRSIWRWAFYTSVISLNSKAFNSAE